MGNIPSDKGSFITHKPISTFLKPYISYYYFHKKESGQPVNFVFYPHVKNGLTIYKNSNTTIEGNHSKTFPDPSLAFKFLYSGIIDRSIHVTITPPFNKIGIAFNPLGINSFIDLPLGPLIKKATHQFDYFKIKMEEVLIKVYESKDIEQKIQLLDAFFIKQYSEFSERRLVEIINYLIQEDLKHSVSGIAEKFCLSRKTLLRLFKTHLNCSVKDYIQVVQFRKALNSYKENQKIIKLGKVAHMSHYYDHSDFIKHFKKITGFNPKKFFKGIEHIGEEDTFWTFNKN